MTEKRFTLTNKSLSKIGNDVAIADDGVPCTQRFVCNLLNELTEENEQLKHDATVLIQANQDYRRENKQLKARIEYFERKIKRERASAMKQHEKWENEIQKENEQLKKELHLMHMRTMFSTVQSFKGDVSKRYKYSKETDTIYDTANHYGQYDKVLDKAEIVMLLNEYETVLNELKR